MARVEETQSPPAAGHAEPVDPVVVPDVATQAHPTGHAGAGVGGNDPQAGENQLQQVLPEITEVAQKVGGFKKLSEIADTLDQAGT